MGTKVKMYEVEFFLKTRTKEEDAERIAIAYPSDDIVQDIIKLLNSGIVKQYGKYTYVYPGHMIQFARIKE